MSSFDVRVFAIRRRPGRAAFEVRWRVARRDKSRSFTARALADSYRAELIRAARRGLEFDPATGEPAAWTAPKPTAISWYRHAVAYAEMKWPRLAPHSRASLADALATVTVMLTRPTARRPADRVLRAALYGYAFNSQQRVLIANPAASALAWLERASLPVTRLSDPPVIRAALDGLCLRLDGRPAAALTIRRKRAVFHNALSYAVELGLLPANPINQVQWRAPTAAAAIHPAAVASPAQVEAILAQVNSTRPELTAFFGCLYYAALRPAEAVALRGEDLILPADRRGKIILTSACPRTGTPWTSTGTPHEPRGLKHRPAGATRVVPIPPVLVSMLRRHLDEYGSTPDGRLFRGARGGILSESVYGRAWHAARQAALGPDLAATTLARRPYDLRHAALSLWLNASAEPAEVAARAGNSARVLHDMYLHCIDSHQDLVSQRIEAALDTDPGSRPSSQCGKASGYTHRRHHPRLCPLYVRGPAPGARVQPTATGPARPATPHASTRRRQGFRSSDGI
jgi:integrase